MSMEVQIKSGGARDSTLTLGGGRIAVGSTGGYDDGWLARITLAEDVHLQLFPKFGMVAMEIADNGNTNLPASCEDGKLLDHLFQGRLPEDGDENPDHVKPTETEGDSAYPYTGDSRRDANLLSKKAVLEAIVKLKKVAAENAAAWGLKHRE